MRCPGWCSQTARVEQHMNRSIRNTSARGDVPKIAPSLLQSSEDRGKGCSVEVGGGVSGLRGAAGLAQEEQ